jgi:outer membrane lipoprotein-sorting protein
LTKKSFLFFNIFFIYIFSIHVSFADIQKKLINQITATRTLTFNFTQEIEDKVETGTCFIKYPLLMKCNYKNMKQKTIISNGSTVAVIKKKYKKIYYYPIKTTPLFFILKKEKILNLVRESKPTEINSNLIKFVFINKKKVKIEIIFDKNTLEFKGWKTKDIYSNNVNFIVSNLQINNQIVDDFFKIPSENDL